MVQRTGAAAMDRFTYSSAPQRKVKALQFGVLDADFLVGAGAVGFCGWVCVGGRYGVKVTSAQWSQLLSPRSNANRATLHSQLPCT